MAPATRPERLEPADAVSTWLAGAHPTPARVRTQWAEDEVALVPLGIRFAAIRIPADLMHAGIGSEHREDVADVARDVFRGPVMIGARNIGGLTYWAIVPWRPGVYWPAMPETPYLGVGTHLSIPAVGCTEPPGPHWIAPPRYAYDLCSRERVFDVVMRGRHIVERESSLGR
ncbi:hypothetical protein [Streptomyces sp. NPDC001091]